MYQGKNFGEVLSTIQTQSKLKHDFLVPGSYMKMDPFSNNLTFSSSQKEVSFVPNKTFHGQMSDALGIPRKYYDKMLSEEKNLLAVNTNTWLGKDKRNFLVRTLANQENSSLTGRAFLSDRYRRIDNPEVVTHLLPSIMGIDGIQVMSCNISDDYLYIKIVNKKVEGEVVVGDCVQAGIVISNSEVGLGSIMVQPLLYRLVCTNGMIINELGTKKYHVGKRIEEGEFGLFSDETIAADNEAFFLKLRDTALSALSQAGFNKALDILKEKAGIEITGKPKEVIELTQKQYGFTNEESDRILEHFLRDNDNSLYGLANAVTRTSQDVDSYQRATELESLGWDILTMPPSMLRTINAAA